MNSLFKTGTKKQQSGFTLFEIVVVIIVTSLVAGIIAPPFVEATKAKCRLVKRNVLLADGRLAMERLVRELREINALESSSSSANISQATDTMIYFNNTGYKIESNSLKRLSENDSSWHKIVSHVSAFSLSYYDQDGTALTDTPLDETNRGKIRRITAEIELVNGSESLTLRSGAYLHHFAFGNSE